MRKTISVDQLRPGMFMVGVEESWLKTPFFFHRRLISQEADIALLKQHGIQQVIIDVSRGLDVAPSPPRPSAQPSPSPADPAPSTSVRAGDKPPVDQETQLLQALASARMVRGEAIASVERVFEGVKTGAPLDCGELRSVVGRLMDRLISDRASMMTMILLHQLQQSDGILFDHCIDVSVLSLVLGWDSQLASADLERLGLGAILHDIGKLRLPHNLLRKNGNYTPLEQRVMNMHPHLGGLLLAQVDDLDDVCRRIVREHHELQDGTGYPHGLSGSELCPLSQIVGLVDRYEALSSSRGTRPAMFPAQAVRELYQLGQSKRYSQDLVERIIRCLGVYPVGSLVELNTGERGIVILQNEKERLRPVIKLLWAKGGRPYAMPWIADLAKHKPGHPDRLIKCVLDPSMEQVNIASCIEDLTVALRDTSASQGRTRQAPSTPQSKGRLGATA